MTERIYYTNKNGIKLCGILTKANNDKIVVMCHGIRGNKDENGSFTYLAEKLESNGYSSFRFDFNGHGESEGNDYEMTISKEISDIESTVKMLEQNGYKDIIILGASFGSGIVSLLNYKNYSSVKALILWYGALDFKYTKFGNLFTEQNKLIAIKDGYYTSHSMHTGEEFKLGLELFDEIDKYKPYEELEKINIPKLFVHGYIDKAVPYQLSEKIAGRCKNSQFILVKNGEHTFQNSKEALDYAVDNTLNFIREIM